MGHNAYCILIILACSSNTTLWALATRRRLLAATPPLARDNAFEDYARDTLHNFHCCYLFYIFILFFFNWFLFWGSHHGVPRDGHHGLLLEDLSGRKCGNLLTDMHFQKRAILGRVLFFLSAIFIFVFEHPCWGWEDCIIEGA